jgi:Transposase DDE domain.
MNPAIYKTYTEIVLTALANAKIQINKSRRNFMIEIFLLYLSIPGRINFLQLGRYGCHGEQYYRREFEQQFDFFSFNAALSQPFCDKRRAIAFDPSFIHKSGKHTPGLGYFWSGCAGKALRGLEVLSLSLIDIDSRMSFHLNAIQTPPSSCLQDHELTFCSWYAAVIKKQIEQIRSSADYLVADAYFSKKGFVDEICDTGLHLVCKLRDDADLLYLTQKIKSGKRGRPAKYGGKVDPKNLNPEYFTEVANNQGIKAQSAVVYSKSLQRNILLVVEEFLMKGKTIYRLLFSSDLNQPPVDIIDIYHTRFQIEFGFRDAKQYAGLENSQARSVNKLDFQFNAALTVVNIAKVMQLKDENRRELPFSMRDCKTLFCNAMMLSRFFSKFGIPPNNRKNRTYVKELLNFGIRAAQILLNFERTIVLKYKFVFLCYPSQNSLKANNNKILNSFLTFLAKIQLFNELAIRSKKGIINKKRTTTLIILCYPF